jgi:hypothetical protein
MLVVKGFACQRGEEPLNTEEEKSAFWGSFARKPLVKIR